MKLQLKKTKNPIHLLVETYLRLYCLRQQKEDGYVLVVVLGILFFLQALLMAYTLIGRIENTSSVASANSNTGFYGAEAGLNLRGKAIQSSFTNFNRPTGSSPSSIDACLDNDTTNNGGGSFACMTYAFSGQNGKPAHTASTFVVERPGNPRLDKIPRGEPFQNLNMQEYGYNLRSATTRAGDTRPEAILGMDIKSRVVPIFQFAVFYKNDLEISPGPAMTLSGPVHTNSNLYLGSGDILRIKGQVTTSGDIFNSRKENGATFPSGRVKIDDVSGTAINLLNANGGTQTNAALSRTNLTNIWGDQVRPGFDPVDIPPISFLSRTGDYFTKADLQFEYRPNSTVPLVQFAVTPLKRDQSTGTVTSSTPLTEGQLRSLGQPVMTNVNCPALTPPVTVLTLTQQQTVATLLKVTIASAGNLVQLSNLSSTLNTLNGGALAPASGGTNLQTLVSNAIGNTNWTIARNLTANQVASLVGSCFKAAPLIVNTTFYNNREAKTMRLLQINMEALTVWNRDGIYVNFATGAVTNTNSNNGFSADQLLFNRRTTIDLGTNLPANSFQRLGLAASDVTDGGLVFHASVVPTATADITAADGTSSPFGFAITNAAQLPGLTKSTGNIITANNINDPTGLSFASDQAIYVQGDYNILDDPTLAPAIGNFGNRQPAAVLADSLNVLSNACLDGNNRLNCGINGTRNNALTTAINAAFLSGTDITNSAATSGYNGGLENYPRFHEDWNWGSAPSLRPLNYRGSFISIGTPSHVRGLWTSQNYDAPGRNWDYDARFDDFALLPPLSPNFVYLRQELFVRDFER